MTQCGTPFEVTVVVRGEEIYIPHFDSRLANGNHDHAPGRKPLYGSKLFFYKNVKN